MPFTTEQFFQVFERYNQSVFPIQIVLSLAALAAVMMVVKPKALLSTAKARTVAFEGGMGVARPIELGLNGPVHEKCPDKESPSKCHCRHAGGFEIWTVKVW